MGLKTISENNSQQSVFQKFAENLRALLKSHHLNANQLAQILGIPMMTIRRLLSGETTDPRISTLKLIADYFNVSVDSLLEGNAQTIINSLKKTKPHFVPKLDWNTIEKITTISDLDLNQWKEWQSISLGERDPISKSAFALESRPSMYPRFPQGTIFIIDPDAIPTDGDIVLIKLKKNDELTLRELIIDPPEWKLYPIVSRSSILQFSEEEHQIIGVNLLTMLYNRRMYG
jgi:transcriptional regulator with XRE-family HTH domain